MDMDLDHPPKPTPTHPKTTPAKLTKTLTLTTTTLRAPPFSYAHLTLTPTPPSTTTNTTTPPKPPTVLDALQIRAYLTTALRQFLGTTGAAIPLDILLIDGRSVWVRVPREDLAAFAAGVTAFSGLSSSSSGSGLGVGGDGEGGRMLLQLRACGDWLGALVGREGEGGLWRD